ncbi:MAG: MATE family efflux transporter [Phycisphaerae bacterium]
MSQTLLESPAVLRPTRATAIDDTADLLWLALPMIGMTVSRMLMGFIDFFMVSQLGTAAQAAISPSTLLLFTIACVGMGMAQGVQTFVSQAEGRGEPERGGAYLWQTMYLAIAAALLSAPIAMFVPVWFPLVGKLGHHSPEMLSMEIQFLQWGLWSIGPMTAAAGLESFFNGVKRPMIGLIAVIASLVTLAVGNWLLIFGHFGLPAMGIAGSGIATLAGWVVRVCVLAIALRSRELDQKYRIRSALRIDLAKLGELLRVGGPVAFQWLVDIGAWLVFIELLIPPFGTASVAAANLAIQFMHLSFMPSIGLGIALTTQVGNAVGAGRLDEAEHRVRVARRVILSYMGLMSLVFLFGGRVLAGLLCFEADADEHARVITAAAQMLIWVAIFQISDAICIVYSFAARGAGDTRVPALLFAVCCWGIFVVGGVLTSRFLPQFGPHGPWMMCTTYIIVLGVLLWRRFHGGKWRDIRIFAQRGDDASPAAVH